MKNQILWQDIEILGNFNGVPTKIQSMWILFVDLNNTALTFILKNLVNFLATTLFFGSQFDEAKKHWDV